MSSIKYFLFYILFHILFSNTLFGQNTFVFNESLKIESLVPYIEKMEGKLDDSVSINAIISQKFNQIPNAKMGASLGEYWFRFKVKNTYNETQSMIIFMKGMSMFKFDIYKEIDGEKLTKIKSLKEGLSLENRLIPHEYEEFLKLTPNKTTTYYINAFFPKSVILPLKAGKILEKVKLDQRIYVKQGLYYGIALMMLVLNLFLFRSFKDISYFYYTVLLISFVLVIAVLDGVIYRAFSEVMSLFFFDFILHFIAVGFLVLFTVRFLDLQYHLPKYIKVIYTMMLLMACSYAIYFFTNKSSWFIYGEFIGVLVILLCSLSGFLVIKKSKFAIFFVIAYGFLMVMFLLFSISVYNPNFGIKADLDYLKLASLVEMCVLTYAVSYRIKLLEKDRQTVKTDLQKVGKELTFIKEGYAKGQISVNEQKLIEFSNFHNLTKQEVKVLLLLLTEGGTNKEIAEQLFISVSTVKFHLANIYGKLGVFKRGDLLVSYAGFEAKKQLK